MPRLPRTVPAVGKQAHAVLGTPVPTSKKDDRDILVLGSTVHPEDVTAYPWDGLPPRLNVADYDIVIVNLQSLLEDPELSERVKSVDLPTVEQFGQLWFSDRAEIIVIGEQAQFVGKASAFFWCPFALASEEAQGQNITATPLWAWYFDELASFRRHFTGPRAPKVDSATYLHAVGAAGDAIDLEIEAIATTRYNKAIALAMRVATYYTSYGAPEFSQQSAGIAYWLPGNPDIPSGELVNLILEHRFGYELSVAAPAWSMAFALPSHREAIIGLQEAEASVGEAHLRLADARLREEANGRFRSLLYEGDHALEELVAEALRKLGAHVVPPARQGIEEARVVAPDAASYMLEVKGLTGVVKRDHVRQLQDWVTLAVSDENDDWTGRGLLVANTHRTLPPNERPEPIGVDLEARAARFDQTVLTTSQLFQALADVESGALTPEAFWAVIATARGRVDLPDAAPSDGDGMSNETPAGA